MIQHPKNILILCSLLLCWVSSGIFISTQNNEEKVNQTEIWRELNKKEEKNQRNIKEIIDPIWEEITAFTEEYQASSPETTYYWAVPIFKWESERSLKGIENIKFYVSTKDISKLSKCNTHNYLIALESIDKLLLKPWEIFNANEVLANQKDYCTGRGEKTFLFYGGVCGMTSQLFRTALMTPQIEIIERHNHTERFVHYYGEEIGGDDAAIYQMNKQFKIKNISEKDIYFRTKRIGDITYVVAITREDERVPVQISKNKISNRKIELKRKKGEKIETFTSIYTNKNYELR